MGSFKLDLTDKVYNGVRVLRRDADNHRYWWCQCPLCHDEFKARVDIIREGRVARCRKHSQRYKKLATQKAELLARSTPSTPEDEAEYPYGAVATYKFFPKRGPKSRDDMFRERVFEDSLLRALERRADRHGHQIWLFQCACGGRIEALRSNVVAGKTRSCGCLPRGRPAGTKPKKNAETPAMQSPTAFLDLFK